MRDLGQVAYQLMVKLELRAISKTMRIESLEDSTGGFYARRMNVGKTLFEEKQACSSESGGWGRRETDSLLLC